MTGDFGASVLSQCEQSQRANSSLLLSLIILLSVYPTSQLTSRAGKGKTHFGDLAGELTASPYSPVCANLVQAKSKFKIKILFPLYIFHNTISLRLQSARRDCQCFIWLAYMLIDDFDNMCSLMIFTLFVQLGILKEC